MKRSYPTLLIASTLASFFGANADAQNTPVTQRPVTVTRYVDQTVMESQQRTKWKPVWQTEKRERRTTVMKPIEKKYDKVEQFTVLRPVTETKYRERQIQETSYEEVTEMREERRIVRKPVIETEMREQAVPIRTKVTETTMQTENVTLYKPVTTAQTQLVPGPAATIDTGVSAFRPQVQFLRRGYYIDPQTGRKTWRGPGLHWVQPPTTSVVPTLVPQTVASTTLVPEVVQRSRPVEVTRYVDKVELRKVPVEVKRMVEEVEVRKVPVTTRRPKTVTRVERIPYQETTYKEQVVTKRTPVTETTYQPVEQVEPYEEQTCRWVQFTEEVKTPKTVRKRVNETIYRPEPKSESKSVLENDRDLQETGSTAKPSYDFKPAPAAATLIETSQRQRRDTPNVTDAGSSRQRIDYSNAPVIRRQKSLFRPDETRVIEVPVTKPDLNNPRTKLAKIDRPDWMDSDESEPENDSPQDEPLKQIQTTDWDAPAATKPD